MPRKTRTRWRSINHAAAATPTIVSAERRDYVERLRAEVSVMPGVEVIGEDQFEDALGVCGRAWCGSAVTDPELGCDWVLGLRFAKRDEPLRLALCRYFLSESLHECIMSGGGVSVGVRTDTGELGAVCFAFPHVNADGDKQAPPKDRAWSTRSHTPVTKKVQESRTDLWPRGPIDEETELSRQRGQQFVLSCDTFRESFANGPHWHVEVVAVDPSVQGRGLAGKALSVVAALADKASVPVYLDVVGERNRRVYERAGFVVAGCRGLELAVPSDKHPPPEKVTAEVQQHYAMLRQAVVNS